MRKIDKDRPVVFDGDGARVLTIDGDGVVEKVESMDGQSVGEQVVGISLADLLAREDLASALEEVRSVLEERVSRFVTWTVSEGDRFRPYAGWLHPNGGGNVVGVLRWFGV